jgi:Ni,Fe-hydrogenase I cytochrome b subunit
VVTGVHWLTVVLLAVLLAGFYLAGALPQITSSGEAGLLPPGLLVLAYVWFRLARRGIQRDIHLVRSVDRLRP